MSRAEARARLRARAAELAGHIEALDRAPPIALGIDVRGLRRILVTGVGSSEANARLLADLLARELGLPARFVSTGALHGDPGGADACLVVFSQALSPNGCIALAGAARFGRAVLVTAMHEGAGMPEREARLLAAQAAGVRVVPLPRPLASESGTLVRLLGPVVASLAAIRFARAFAPDDPPTSLQLATAGLREVLATADRRSAEVLECVDPDRALVLVAHDGYAERVRNLPLKLAEGLLAPSPWLGDAVEFAHGPLQQHHGREADVVFLSRPDEPEEAAWIERVRAVLPPAHRLLVLPSGLPGAFATLDHEAQWNAILLRSMDARDIDPEHWPGQGADDALYAVGPGQEVPAPAATPAFGGERSLATATSPEIGAALAGGASTAVIALGSTEQHGAHLPLATDTWVGDALASAFCRRVPEAWRCPTLPLGCASEHMSFPGTLSIGAATLEAILRDLLNSLSRHGFSHAFVFSAHGGNATPLAEMAPRLRPTEGALAPIVFADHAAVTRACQAVAVAAGVEAAAAGHHAGEFETSIVAALHAGAVRDRLEPGRTDVGADAQHLFDPDLRANAPNGVVGDPRGFDPRRAEGYLGAWVDLLVDAYEREKKRHQTKGTVKA